MLEFHHLNFYLLRSPLHSLETTSAFLQLQELSAQEIYLRSMYSSSYMQDALFLSSPELFKQVKKWLDTDIPLSNKLHKTLYKYTVRMGTRSTPYGLFAGVSLGKILKSDRYTHIKRTLKDTVRYRLDMQYLSMIIQYVLQDPIIRSQVKYSVNHTLFQQGNIYKFYQQQYNSTGMSKHYLRKIKSTTVLDFILKGNKSDQSYNELIELLVKKGANITQARNFVDKLIENGILYPDLSIQITSEDFYETFLSQLKSLTRSNKYADVFDKIGKSLISNDSLIDKHTKIENLTKEVIPETRAKNLIQGDLLLGVEDNTISEKDINRIAKALQDLLPMTIQNRNEDLEKFKKAFQERYDAQMIPLLEALDPDTGIGYGTLPEYIQPDDIISEVNSVKHNRTDSKPNDVVPLIFNRYLHTSDRSKIKEIVLTESDITSLGDIDIGENVPSTFYAIGNILYYESPDTEPIFCLNACGGTSAANLLTRFWDLDEEIRRNILEIGRLEQEKFTNSVVAEIVHLPEARTGNILQRPNMRKAEIALMARCAQGVTRLEVGDLYIFVNGNRLILWSKKLNCQITPRLTSAHNFKTGMTIYRFLSDLQNQDGILNLKMNWGQLEKCSFLPRVRYKNIILTRAKWNIPRVEYQPHNDSMVSVLNTIRETYQLPQMVLLSEGDNELLIDLFNPISCKILFDKLCKQNVILDEYIFSEFGSPVKDGANTYANEIIIPLATTKEYKENFTAPVSAPHIKRQFPLGSEWIYAKIYCGVNSAEYILTEVIPRIVETLNKETMLEKWFFIRYRDPKHHIRLRIKATKKEHFSGIVSVINNMLADLLEAQQIHNLQFDTYVREIERYTPENIEHSEELFHWDSREVIAAIKEYPNIEDRWRPAISGIADYLSQTEMDTSDKLQFVEKIRTTFSIEFGNNKQNNKILNLKYRKHQKTIENILSIDKGPSTGKAIALASIFNNLWNVYEDREQVLSKRQTLIASYIHMFVNRIFDNNQRKYEYALYHLLSNHYRSLEGRKNITVCSTSRV